MMSTEISREKITYFQLKTKSISAIATAETTCDLSNIVTWTVSNTAWAEHVEIGTKFRWQEILLQKLIQHPVPLTYLLLFVPKKLYGERKSCVLQYYSIKLKTSNFRSIAVCIHYVLHRRKASSREVSFYRQNYISNE